MNAKLGLFYILLIFVFNLSAQEEEAKYKGADFMPSFSVYYAYEIPAGDLAVRFGDNNKVGAAFSIKFSNNWIVSLDAGYMFGENLHKEAYSILDGLKTEDGQITSKFGTPGSIIMSERGYTIMFKGGKILPFLQANINSGPFIMGGIGFLQHKIRIDNKSNDTPQVSPEYRPGYDHLTYGIAFNQFVGYRLYARNKMTNFYAGVEWTQALTKNRRGYNYNTMSAEDDLRLDMLYSFKVGLIIPLVRRSPKDFYTY